MTAVPIEGTVVGSPDADPIGTGWRRLALLLSIPAVLIGVVAYPNVQLATMPLGAALPVLLAAAALIVLSGRTRLLVLLPLISAYLPSAEIGFVASA